MDPSFFFPIDSTGWQMDSDSLLKKHWQRFGWDIACGGFFTVSQGRVYYELRIVYIKNNKPQKKIMRASAVTDSVQAMCTSLFEQVAAVAGITVPSQLHAFFLTPVSTNPLSFATYCAGYYREMLGDVTGAITAYERACELAPHCAFSLCRLAQLYRTSAMLPQARQCFARVLSYANDHPLLIAAVADFYITHESASRALEFIKGKQSILEKTAAGMTVIGKSLIVSGQLQRGIAMLTRAVAQGPTTLENDFILGRAYLTGGDFDRALEVFNRLAKYQPANPRFLALLGAAYRNSGRPMEALKILERSNSVTPGNLPIQANLAQVYYTLGWYEKAIQILQLALEKNPGMPELYVNCGVVSYCMGKKNEAQRYFGLAADKSKNMQSAINNEANILLLNGETDKAIETYKNADRLGGRNEKVLSNLAFAYMAKNRPNDAAACFDIVLTLAPSRLDVLEQCARIAEQRGKEQDAINYLRKILEQSPANENALYKLVGLLKKQGAYKECIDILDAYLNDYPDSKKFLFLQAEIYRSMGWYEVAITKYQSIIKDYSGDAQGYLGLGRNMFDLIQFKNSTDYDKTIYYLKIAADLDKKDPEPDYIMGLIYRDYKNYSELALDSFRAGLAKASDPDMKKKLSDLLAKAGK
jgi:tetratricopeptide (TPR) repeat protein